jgi:hypothetical protein
LNPKAPRFFNDLYRDLRDRRLLLPSLALIVALIAVPVLLLKPAEPAPAPPAVAATADASEVTSAVLVDSSVDVRNYRKRLAKLKSKNPFTQHFGVANSPNVADNGGLSADNTAAPPVANPNGTPSTPPPAPTGGGSTSTSVSSGSPTSPATTTPDTTTPDSGSGDSGGSGDTQAPPQIRFVAGRVDVTVGPIGEGKDIDNVKYLTFLPNDKDPIAAFVGLTTSGENARAVFALSSLAEVSGGDGVCAPHKPAPCQFLTLKPGEERFIKYNDKTYRLKVRGTSVVNIKHSSDAIAHSTSSTDDGAGDGNGSTGGDQPQG